MAFQSTGSEGLLNWQPQPQLPEYTAQQELWQRNADRLIKELRDQDQASRQYQAHLESRLLEERAYLQQERRRSSQLEQNLADSEWARNQVESTLRHTTRDVEWLRQELDVQKRRSADSESRALALASLNESLLKMMLDTIAMGKTVQNKSIDVFQICSDIQKQDQLIKGLQITNRYHEESIRCLQAASQAALLASSNCASSCSSDMAIVVGTASGTGHEYSPELPTESNAEAANNPQGASGKEGSWYEE